MRRILLAAGAALMLAAGPAATAATAATAAPEVHAVTLTLKDHRFTPQTLEVPAGRKIRIDLVNRDAALEEFDSDDLHVEKDVTPNGRVSFTVGPLAPGVYSFMGELHAGDAQGVLKAVAQP